ncbi:MAG: hypothetical protein N2594_07825 [Clostridiales bacterium]|nr:hypothetical protein [Clostridiales bacterium]
MTFLGITVTFFIGLLLLIAGVVTKNKWFMFISIVPLAISIIQVLMLLMM